MAFLPNTTIKLCSVPFDNTYKDVVRFNNEYAQTNYFNEKTILTLEDYLTVRTTKADGSLQTSIKVNMKYDHLISYGINYVMYDNGFFPSALHPDWKKKYYYAFVTQIKYVNEQTSELIIETDVFQTWFFNVDFLPSFIVREHSKYDQIGDNVIPEKFEYNDFTYYELDKYSGLTDWVYLIGTSHKSYGRQINGMYQGLTFYAFEDDEPINQFLAEMQEEYGDCIIFIGVVPKFCITAEPELYEDGELTTTYNLNHKIFDFKRVNMSYDFDGYEPKNNKLHTAPFTKFIIQNHAGEEAEYNIEDFASHLLYDESGGYISFEMYGDVSANPSVTICPQYYKGIANNYDCGISLKNFPQCSFNNDTFKLWIAKNQYTQDLVFAKAGIGIVSNALSLNASGVVNSAFSIADYMNTQYQASREPNRNSQGNPLTNLRTLMMKNCFDFYIRKIKKHYAKAIDDYFTMFGYATNEVKKPNLFTRPFFNYVQTVDIKLSGNIPNNDMKVFKNIFNNGVTLWDSKTTIGDYTVDNKPQESEG